MSLRNVKKAVHCRLTPASGGAFVLALFFIGAMAQFAQADETHAMVPEKTAQSTASSSGSSSSHKSTTTGVTASTTSVQPAADPGAGNAGGFDNAGAPLLDAAEGSGIGNGGMASVEPSTGTASASIPFRLPHARGDVQPSLGISYSSTGSNTEVGYAWTLNLPSIVRENRGGGPQYHDPAAGAALDPNSEDRFRINGVDLVPICLVSGGQCTSGGQLQPGEQLPDGLDGWHYFRTRVDQFARYFWSPDHRTFRVDTKSGVQMEFGVPLDDSGNTNGVDTDHSAGEAIFRWNLVRQWSHGHANVVRYDWTK